MTYQAVIRQSMEKGGMAACRDCVHAIYSKDRSRSRRQKAIVSLAAAIVFSFGAFCGQAFSQSRPDDTVGKTNTLVERFPDPFILWKDRFFYKATDAESYYDVTGSDIGFRPVDSKGLWITPRGVAPSSTTGGMTIQIKADIGLEATYFAFGVNSHLSRLTIKFIDKEGKVFAESCAPKTEYYVYTPIAVPIKNGLKAIRFDGHGGQVSGNVNINDVEVIFGTLPPDKDFIIHEMNAGVCRVVQQEKNPTPSR